MPLGQLSVRLLISIIILYTLKHFVGIPGPSSPDPPRCRYEYLPRSFQKNRHFTGRIKLLQTLREKLSDEKSTEYNHRVALSGLGGVGKTQIAIQYVVERKADYDGVFWVSAASRAELLSDYQKIAKTIGMTATEDSDPERVATEVLEWLESRGNWLLVLDNVDDANVIDSHLPRLGSTGHTLITTRASDTTGLEAQGLKVDVFLEDDAQQLLLLRAGFIHDTCEKAKAEALKIVKELGFLALAIEQAAAYIRVQLKDIYRFLPDYQIHHKQILAQPPKQVWTYPKVVATTWLLSFEAIKQKSVDSELLLNLFAFLNPDGILVEFLYAGFEGLTAPLRTVIGDSFKFTNALAALEQFSLIGRADNGQLISIHRLVQTIVKDRLQTQEKKENLWRWSLHYLRQRSLNSKKKTGKNVDIFKRRSLDHFCL